MPRASGNVRLRVVVDTNSWISNYIRPQSLVAKRLEQLLGNAAVELLFSLELREELLRVIKRPKFGRFISPEQMTSYLKQINAFVLTIVTSEVTDCRDPKDNFLLALCQDGHADFLITGDQDLLVLDPFHRTRIVTWAMAETEPSLLIS